MTQLPTHRDGIRISGHDLKHIFQMSNATEIHLLLKLKSIEYMETILIPTAVRKQICEELKISPQNFTNVFSSLKKRGWLSGSDGQYTINSQ